MEGFRLWERISLLCLSHLSPTSLSSRLRSYDHAGPPERVPLAESWVRVIDTPRSRTPIQDSTDLALTTTHDSTSTGPIRTRGDPESGRRGYR